MPASYSGLVSDSLHYHSLQRYMPAVTQSRITQKYRGCLQIIQGRERGKKSLKALGMNCKCLITGFVKMFEHEIQLFFQTQVKVVSVKKVPSCGLCGVLVERVCTQIKTSPISL